MSRGTADAVVIGAGILGAAAAHYLTLAGRHVVVLERGAPNREGSGTTAGNLHMQAIHTRRPGQDVPADRARFLPLQIAASALWSQVEAALDSTVELRRSGGLMVAETPEQVDELYDKCRMEREAGLRTEVIDGAAAREALPLLSSQILAADWCDQDGYANPLLVTPAYLQSARRRGAIVQAFAPVTQIERHRAGGYTVKSSSGQWTTPVVIDVAGPWIADVAALAGIYLRMTPVAIQMHATMRTRPIMRHLVQHVAEGLSVKQVAAGNILIGGGWPAAGTNLMGRSPTSAASLLGNLSQATRILPCLSRLRLLRAWAGPLAATPDEMPVIGEVPDAPGFLIAGGTYAFTLAPLWGAVLAALVNGQASPVYIEDLSPSRLVRDSCPASATQTGISWE